jgi:hypothetical protein
MLQQTRKAEPNMAANHQVTEQPEPPAGRTLGMIITLLIVIGSLAVPIFFVLR